MTMGPQLVRTALGVLRHPTATRGELKAFQDSQLRRLVVHAYESVPFYRKLFDRHRLHPRHIRGTVDLDLIPIVSKQELRAQAARNLLAIRRTWLEQSLQYSLRLRALGALGARIKDRTATVGLMGRDGLQEPAAIVAQLRAFRPDVITGMPGMLCRVADYLQEHGRQGISPRLLIVEGEVLAPAMRRNLIQAFGSPVRQMYARPELPLLGWECGSGGEFHVSDDGVILEVLHDGRPAVAGEPGEVVATNLHSYAMPFIRYRLGDIATRGKEGCTCGQPFSTIRSIQGRMTDYFPHPAAATA